MKKKFQTGNLNEIKMNILCLKDSKSNHSGQGYYPFIQVLTHTCSVHRYNVKRSILTLKKKLEASS